MESSADLCPLLVKANLVVWSTAGSAWKCSVSDGINLHNSIFIKKIDSQYFVNWLNLFRCITALLCTQITPKAHVIATHNVRCQTHPPTPGTRILLSLAASTMLWLLTDKIVACFWVCGNSQYMNQWRYLERGSHLLSGHDIPHIEDIFHRANSWWHHPVASDAQGEVGFCRPDVQHFTRLPRGCCVSQSAEENIPRPLTNEPWRPNLWI